MNKNKIMYETDRLVFKVFDGSDMTDEYYSWFYDQEVTKYNSHGLFPYSYKQREDFLKSIESGERFVLAVYTKPATISQGVDNISHTPSIQIGNIDLTSFDWINRSAELAIVIGDKTAWGQGYGTEMCNVILEHGFKKLNMNRIWTGTADPNAGMKRLAGTVGMKYEGEFRQGKYLNGKYVNIVVYSILKEEYDG